MSGAHSGALGQPGERSPMTGQSPSARLMWLTIGYQVSQAIHVAATLGIADLLHSGPRSSIDLAVETGTHQPSLYRLLRALAAVEVFREEPLGHFALTPMGECLCSDSVDPVGPWASLCGTSYMWEAWGHFLHTVQTGENAFRHIHGVDPWTYRSRHPIEQAIFDHAMTAHSRRSSAGIVQAFDFGRFRRIIDVGGGQGCLLGSILAACGATRGVLFDQPQVVARAGDLLSDAGVADRCEIISGSLFESIPDRATLASSNRSSTTGQTLRLSLSFSPAVGRSLRAVEYSLSSGCWRRRMRALIRSSLIFIC